MVCCCFVNFRATSNANMSLSRFYLPAAEWTDDALTLTGDEAQHCARVLRKQRGAEIEIFDGAGGVANAVIEGVSKSEVRTGIVGLRRHDPLPYAIHVLPALIKAEPFEWLLEKAVELGAASIQPVATERTVVHLAGDQLDKKMAKWRRQMIESAKQCHTPFLPVLKVPRTFAEAVAYLPGDVLKIMPALSEHSRTLHGIAAGFQQAFVAIGPEGDFTSDEEELARRNGFQPVTLGPLVLRAETAAIAALAILGHEMRHLTCDK